MRWFHLAAITSILLVASFASAAHAQAGALDEAKTWTDWMREAGGWGVSVVLGIAIIFLWRTMRSDAELARAELKAAQKQLTDLLEKQLDVLRGLKGGG